MASESGESGPDELFEAALRYWDRKCVALDALSDSELHMEATFLCLVYIESLGNRMRSDRGSDTGGFVETIREFGDAPFLMAVHLETLAEQLAPIKKRAHLARHIHSHVSPSARKGLYETADLDELFRGKIPVDDIKQLHSESWRGTVAAIAYGTIRSEIAHMGSSHDSISFDGATFRGAPAPTADFEVFFRVLKNVVAAFQAHCRERKKYS